MPARKGKTQPQVESTVKSSLVGNWTAFPVPAPDDFDEFLDWYNTVPIVHAAIDVVTDHCMSAGYKLEPEDPEWEDDVNLVTVLRQAFKGLAVYGNWFIEIVENSLPWSASRPGLIGVRPQLLEPKLTPKGTIESYKDKYSTEKTYSVDKFVFFRGDVIGEPPWAASPLRSISTVLSYKLAMENQQFNIHKQFAAPIHVIMAGKDQKNSPTRTDIEQLLEDLHEMREEESRLLAIGKNLDQMILGAGREIPDFKWLMDHFDDMAMIGVGVPFELIAKGAQVTEATAKVRYAAFNRMIQARQHVVEEGFNDYILNRMSPPRELKFNPLVEPMFNVPSVEQGKPQEGAEGQSEAQEASPLERGRPIPAR